MDKRQRDWLVWCAAVMIIAGAMLSLGHTCTGWLLILLGMAYLCGLTSAGRRWVAENPDYLRWGLIAGAVMLVILVIGVII